MIVYALPVPVPVVLCKCGAEDKLVAVFRPFFCMNVKVFKLKPGKEKQWEDWCRLLQTILYQEALSTVLEERGTFELFCLFQVGNDYYTIGLSDTKQSARTNVVLNQRHQQQKKECLERSVDLNVLYALDASRD